MNTERHRCLMSIDGVGILKSDLAHDVYNKILDLHDAGLDYPQIQERMSSYEESSVDDLDLEIYLTIEEFRRIHDERTVFHADLIPLAALLKY